MKIDVFVSYHADSARQTAEAVVNKLEQQGLRCWYQDRDTGGRFADVIKSAIDECGVFVVLLNQGACKSRHIRTEVSLAYDRDEVEIIPLRLEDVKLSNSLEYYLHGIHWIDAVNRSLDAALDDLCRHTLKALNMTAPRAQTESQTAIAPNPRIVTIEYDDGRVYTGEVVDGKRHGKGKLVWRNGDIYEGDWRDDKRHGKGIFVWTSGNLYEGDWRNDERHGKGKLTWKSGSCYEGDFSNGVRTGKGKISWGEEKKRAGDIYEGDFVNGERTGTGTYTYANGRVEFGRFLKGVFQS